MHLILIVNLRIAISKDNKVLDPNAPDFDSKLAHCNIKSWYKQDGKEQFSTTIGLRDGFYKIPGLGIQLPQGDVKWDFTNLKTMVWLANITNKFLWKVFSDKSDDSWNLSWIERNFSPGIFSYYWESSHAVKKGLFYDNGVKGVVRAIKHETLKEHFGGEWKENYGEAICNYLGTRISDYSTEHWVDA